MIETEPFLFLKGNLLFSRMNCFRRTNIRASTALCTSFRIDRIDIAFRDSAYRTLIDASTASNTIVTNYVSHFLLDFKLLVLICSAKIAVFFISCYQS